MKRGMDLPALVPGRLVRRYNRFLADVALETGEIVVAHCANPGSMMGLSAPGNRVHLALSDDPGRKLRHSWKLVEVDFGWRGPQLVSIDTTHPNRLAEEAIRAGRIASLSGYATLRREVRYGASSRIDLLLEDAAGGRTYVEVKNVHLMRRPGLAEFPDCVTSRGAKHLGELAAMVREGHRAVMLYVVQMEAERFALAGDLDPAYARAFAIARAAGVEMLCHACAVTTEAITLDGPIPIVDLA
jgi:sugar fermentation stimulation protein A